ncbi:hypothetical protein [Chlamydia vaughanii]|uniref:hypothetical protein n=1 Tax=Chlamydia vaughanii TaxID=3112552 RepID=UPI0032B293BA
MKKLILALLLASSCSFGTSVFGDDWNGKECEEQVEQGDNGQDSTDTDSTGNTEENTEGSETQE